MSSNRWWMIGLLAVVSLNASQGSVALVEAAKKADNQAVQSLLKGSRRGCQRCHCRRHHGARLGGASRRPGDG